MRTQRTQRSLLSVAKLLKEVIVIVTDLRLGVLPRKYSF